MVAINVDEGYTGNAKRKVVGTSGTLHVLMRIDGMVILPYVLSSDVCSNVICDWLHF